MSNLFTLMNVTNEHYTNLLTKLKTELGSGLSVSTDGVSGTGAGKGVEFTWSYHGTPQQLNVTIIKKPFLYKESMVENQIREWCEN